MIKISQHILACLVLLIFIGTSNSFAALPIAECKTFLNEELELLCLKSSIEARIEDELPYDFPVVRHSYSREDVEFYSRRLISLSPAGRVNYDIHTPVHICYPISFGRPVCNSGVHVDQSNPFIERVLDGEILSYDDPEFTFFELKYFVEYGNAYVSLKKRTFNDNNEEIE